MKNIPSIESVPPLEHCAKCGDVIFKWGTGWVHGTDHVAVPETPEEAEVRLHRHQLDEEATLIISPDPKEESDD